MGDSAFAKTIIGIRVSIEEFWREDGAILRCRHVSNHEFPVESRYKSCPYCSSLLQHAAKRVPTELLLSMAERDGRKMSAEAAWEELHNFGKRISVHLVDSHRYHTGSKKPTYALGIEIGHDHKYDTQGPNAVSFEDAVKMGHDVLEYARAYGLPGTEADVEIFSVLIWGVP